MIIFYLHPHKTVLKVSENVGASLIRCLMKRFRLLYLNVDIFGGDSASGLNVKREIWTRTVAELSQEHGPQFSRHFLAFSVPRLNLVGQVHSNGKYVNNLPNGEIFLPLRIWIHAILAHFNRTF